MKRLLIILIAFFVVPLNAQEVCSEYYPMQTGTKFQLTSYEKKDKVSAILNYEVKDAGSDWALLSYDIQDAKGKSLATSEYEIKCVEDGVAIDFKSLGAPGVLDQYEGMEVEVSGTNLFLPNDLIAGRELPDAEMKMAIKMSPITMNMGVWITNRKVTGNESITTPAGTYNCVVMSYDFESKMGIKVSGSTKQWLAEGVGLVRSEDYNKKGKLLSYTELTAFN